MKNNTLFRSLLAAAFFLSGAFGFTSCDDDKEIAPSVTPARGPYDQKGVFILNEGNFGTPNGSISFLSDSANKAVENNISQKANNDRLLGDVVMDLDFVGDRAYIVANNSNKLEVVNAYTFKTEGIVDLQQPRYFAVASPDKAYVSEWVQYGQTGQVSVINLNTLQVVKTIAVGPQPEELLVVNGKLYVTISGADVVTVINVTTDAIEQQIQVTDGPAELETDQKNKLWVLAKGKTVYNPDWTVNTTASTPGALVAINTANNMVLNTMTFGSNEVSPGNLAITADGGNLYYNFQDATYTQSASSTSLATTPLLARSFYGLGIDPDNGYLYGSDTNNFSGDGKVLIYQPDGTKVKEITVGIAPNGFVFN
ncbi:YncE family protein [Pontibacter sp. CAU 1760]